MWLRLCIGPNAFGNALGSSLAAATGSRPAAVAGPAEGSIINQGNAVTSIPINVNDFGPIVFPEIDYRDVESALDANEFSNDIRLEDNFKASQRAAQTDRNFRLRGNLIRITAHIPAYEVAPDNFSTPDQVLRDCTMSNPNGLAPYTAAEVSAIIRANPLNANFTEIPDRPSFVQRLGGAFEVTGKGLVNTGVGIYAGLAGSVDALFNGGYSGAATVNSIVQDYSVPVTSAGGIFTVDALSRTPVMRGLQNLKSDTGDYYSQYGPFSAALGSTAPDALLLLSPFAPKAFRNFAGAVSESTFGPSAGSLAAQRGSASVDLLTLGMTDGTSSASQLSPVQINAQNGAAFQARVASYAADTLDNFVEEVSIRPHTDLKGNMAKFRVRLDGMGADAGTAGVELLDAKATATAPLTANQTAGYPLIEQFGGTVVGKAGNPFYPAGTVVKPTKVQIIRPIDLPKGY